MLVNIEAMVVVSVCLQLCMMFRFLHNSRSPPLADIVLFGLSLQGLLLKVLKRVL